MSVKFRSNAASLTDIPYSFITARPTLERKDWAGFCIVLFGVASDDIDLMSSNTPSKFIDCFPDDSEVNQFVNFNDGPLLDKCDWLQLTSIQINQLYYLLTPYAARTKNLKQNQDDKGTQDISLQTQKRIKEIVDVWSECVRIEAGPARTRKKAAPHTLVFLTLTYPHGNEVEPLHSKRHHLGAFIQDLKRKGYADTYLWKMELHKNGQIHFHILSDKKIHHEELRDMWNKVISKDGHISKYTAKFSAMTESEYISYRQPKDDKEAQEAQKAYRVGVSEGWARPNTTDVHKVQQTENLAAYVGKYISKKIASEEHGQSLENLGRLWGCSDQLRNVEWPKIEYHRELLDDPTTLIYDSLPKLLEVMHSPTKQKRIITGDYGQQFIIFKSNTEKILKEVDKNILCYYLEHYNKMIDLIYPKAEKK